MYQMIKSDWVEIKDFCPEEFGAEDMSTRLIYTMQDMRNYVGRRINVHSGYRPGRTGYHPLKMAADIDIVGLDVIDQYLIAEKFDALNGIGVYPFWNNQGIHVDVRPRSKLMIDSRWGCFEAGKYVKLDSKFFRRINSRTVHELRRGGKL